MSTKSASPLGAASLADTSWGIGVEVDLHTALAFARASVVAMQKLSESSKGAINEALMREAAILEINADPLSKAAAQSLIQTIREAA